MSANDEPNRSDVAKSELLLDPTAAPLMQQRQPSTRSAAPPPAADPLKRAGSQALRVPPDDSQRVTAPTTATFDALIMMENEQRLLMLKGAQKSLENYKAFRAQTELLMGRRMAAINAEFNGPLVLASDEIELLKLKLARRDETIKELRTALAHNDALHKQGESEEVRRRVAAEPVRLQELLSTVQDDVIALQRLASQVIHVPPPFRALLLGPLSCTLPNSPPPQQEAELRDRQQRLDKGRERERDLKASVHKYEGMITEYTHEVNMEAARYQELLHAKDDAIAAKARELEQALSQIVELNRVDSERAVVLEKLKKETELLHAQMKEERKEKKAAVKAMEEAENTANECSSAIAELTEENTDLKRRYEVLVAELDRMVQEDYYLPPEGPDAGGRGPTARRPRRTADKGKASTARLKSSASTAGGGMRKGRGNASKASLSSSFSSDSESVASFSSRSSLLSDRGKKSGKRKENTASIIHEKMKKGKRDRGRSQRAADGPKDKDGPQKQSGSETDGAAPRGDDADGHSKRRRSREPLNDSDSDDEKAGKGKASGVAEEKANGRGPDDGPTQLTAANLASLGAPTASVEDAAPALPLHRSSSSAGGDGGGGGGPMGMAWPSARGMTKVSSKGAFKSPVGRFLEQKLAEDRSAQVRRVCLTCSWTGKCSRSESHIYSLHIPSHRFRLHSISFHVPLCPAVSCRRTSNSTN